MGHEEQVAAAMTAFFNQQFAQDPSTYAPKDKNAYDPEEAYKPDLELIDNPFAQKPPPGTDNIKAIYFLSLAIKESIFVF